MILVVQFLLLIFKKFFPKIEIKSNYKDGDRVKKIYILLMNGNARKMDY